MKVQLMHGDCLDKLKELEDNSVDSIVTDPPYMIGFMGKTWDKGDDNIVANIELWKECLRVLKPGGHLLSFGATRTYHRMTVAVEDAGFEIRDCIFWCYGSGFPKSHNIGKAVDKLQGNEREVVGKKTGQGDIRGKNGLSGEIQSSRPYIEVDITKGNSPYEGWGTALKPAVEPVVMARKPFKGSVAENVLEWGTGGINIDGCRIGTEGGTKRDKDPGYFKDENGNNDYSRWKSGHNVVELNEGRFPANLIFGHNPDCKLVGYDEEIVIGGNKGKSGFANGYEKGDFTKEVKKVEKWECTDGCAVKILDEQSGITSQGHWPKGKTKGFGEFGGGESSYEGVGPKDTEKAGASRFFYCPKSSKKDRNEGCDSLEEKTSAHSVADKCNKCGKFLGASANVCKCEEPERVGISSKNNHPTIKPTALMTYLIRLVTPKNGTVLDPFMGSGSTGKAAIREGMSFIGIEREDEYIEIAEARIQYELDKNKHRQFFEED